MDQASTKKMTPGDDMHLTLLMAPHNLDLVTGQDRQHLLAFGRAAFEAGQYATKDNMLLAVMAENEQLKAQLAAAQQGVHPFGYVNTQTGQFFKDVEPCRKNNEGHWHAVYANHAAQVLEPVEQRQLDIGKAIERACQELPEGAEIQIYLERAPLTDAVEDGLTMQQWQHPNQDAKDAARYRWLRERDLETVYQGGVFAGKTPENLVLNGNDLDEAIDAAMAAQAKKGGV